MAIGNWISISRIVFASSKTATISCSCFMESASRSVPIKYFGNALDVDRQIFLSNNLHCVNSFLISEDGKEYVCILVDAFKDFVEKEKQKQQ